MVIPIPGYGSSEGCHTSEPGVLSGAQCDLDLAVGLIRGKMAPKMAGTDGVQVCIPLTICFLTADLEREVVRGILPDTCRQRSCRGEFGLYRLVVGLHSQQSDCEVLAQDAWECWRQSLRFALSRIKGMRILYNFDNALAGPRRNDRREQQFSRANTLILQLGRLKWCMSCTVHSLWWPSLHPPTVRGRPAGVCEGR